jgi:hypothetical protein
MAALLGKSVRDGGELMAHSAFRSTLAALLFGAAIAASAQTAPGSTAVRGQPPLDGTITGVVVDNDSDPVDGASICTQVSYENGSGTSCGGTLTDAHGQFTVHVQLGEIGIYSEKIVGGFWPSMVGIRVPNGNVMGIKAVTLTREAPTAKVRLKIGPKPGELKFAVVDKSTGKPVEGFSVRCIGMDDTRTYSNEGGPSTSVPIPPGIDVIVEVHAKGFHRWFYLDPATSQPVLRLASSEERHLDVELEPEEKR